jgi:hypothetical protein
LAQSYTRTVHVNLPDGIEGDFHILVFTDSNLTGAVPPHGPGIGFERFINQQMARVPEFQDEGNNVVAEPSPILLSTPPDLQVTLVDVPERVTAGQSVRGPYTVTNDLGEGPTRKAVRWDDLIYLSRDQFLDLSQRPLPGFHIAHGRAGSPARATKFR